MIILDTTIVSVAQPSIQADLGFSASGLAWVVNAYLIPFGGLLLLAGRLGDLLGRRRVFLAGLALFTLASLLCGLATTQGTLVAARFLQGVGGALTSAVVLGMIVAMYDDQRERTRAIAVYAFVGSAGASLGTVLGGVLTDLISWHWIFFVNLPIGVATLLAARRWVADDDGLGLRNGADAPGAVLIVAALMLAVYALVGAGEHGWGSARTLGLGAVALALLAAFVVRERHASQPLVPLRLFAVRNVAAANLVQTVMIAGMFGQQFFIALYLQLVLGWAPTEVGLGMVPIALTIGVFSLGLSARMIERAGAKGVLVGGLLLITAGLLLMQRAPVDGRYWIDVLPALLVMGAGAGIAMPALPTPRARGRDAGRRRPRLRPAQHDPAGRRGDRRLAAGESRRRTQRDPARRGPLGARRARLRLLARLRRRRRPGAGGGGAGGRAAERRADGGLTRSPVAGRPRERCAGRAPPYCGPRAVGRSRAREAAATGADRGAGAAVARAQVLAELGRVAGAADVTWQPHHRLVAPTAD